MSVLTEVLYICIVHCQNTHRCTMHVQSTLYVHIACAVYNVSPSMVHSAREMYAVSALNYALWTYSVHC